MGGATISEVLEECERMGIFHVELSAPHPFEPIDSIKKVLLKYKDRGFNYVLHNYFPPREDDFVLNIASNDDSVMVKNLKLITDALDVAKHCGASIYGIHSGYLADASAMSDGMFQFKDKKNDYASCVENVKEVIEILVDRFKGCEVKLLMENLFPGPDENYSLACNFDEIKELMDNVSDEVGLLLDLGHLNIASNILNFDKYEFLEKYLKEYSGRLYEVHLSENDGKTDQHLHIEKDSWQIKVLKDIAKLPISDGSQRVYCLESRNSESIDLLKSSMDIITGTINS